jgi:DNA repair protein RecN (Recombination protein N)
MIESIYIENFAIIDKLQLDFDNQMIALTGETGAGKSIIIDAIGQLLGERTQVNFIKEGTDKAFIEGVFSIFNNIVVQDKLKEFNFSEEDTIIVSKTIQKDGKATIKLNYRTISQALLKEIMPNIVDIHSQFETHSLFDEKNHLHILDHFIGYKIDKLRISYQEAFSYYKNIEKKYNQASKEELSDEQLDFYQSRLTEIETIDIDTLDEEAIEQEEQKLHHYEKINQRISKYQQYMDHANYGVLTNLNLAIKELEYLTDFEEYKETYNTLYDTYYNVLDIHETIIDNFRNTAFDEYRLQEIQETLLKLQRLKKKYGASLETIKEAKKDLQDKIDNFKNRDAFIEEMHLEMQKAKEKYYQIATEITKIRKKEAETFSKLVKKELKNLYLPNVEFSIQFTEIDGNIDGRDKVVFMISTNLSQNVLPLQKVASGGELSRIMLAIKSVLMRSSSIATIIFDEADTGVSGKVAESIGIKMQEIAKTKQVLCITHLAQVASFANHHYYIEKTNTQNKVQVRIKKLNMEESIAELAKMISGKEITDQSIEHARNLKNKKYE